MGRVHGWMAAAGVAAGAALVAGGCALGAWGGSPAAAAAAAGAQLVLTGPSQQQTTLSVQSFQFGESNGPTVGSQSSGAGAGKVTLETLTVQAAVDKNTTAILQAVAAGTRYATGDLALSAAVTAGAAAPMTVRFLSLEPIKVTLTGPAPDVESIDFAYTGLETSASSTGAPLGPSINGWNRVTNSASAITALPTG